VARSRNAALREKDGRTSPVVAERLTRRRERLPSVYEPKPDPKKMSLKSLREAPSQTHTTARSLGADGGDDNTFQYRLSSPSREPRRGA